MEKRIHIPSGKIFVKDQHVNYYLEEGGKGIVPEYITQGLNWEEVKEPERLKIEIVYQQASQYKHFQCLRKSNGADFTKEEITAIENILNGESFTREDMIEFADFYLNSSDGTAEECFENWIKSRDINR